VPLPASVRELLERKWGVAISTRATVGSNLPTIAATTLLRQDPSRVGFLFVNLGTVPAFLAPVGPVEVSASNGIKVEPLGGNLFTDWEEDGEIVAWEWRSIAPGGPIAMFLFEFVIDQGTRPQVEATA
jgi:hypothetical protein